MDEKPVKNDISKKYVKMDQREHLLSRSAMYLGSIEADTYEIWLLNEEGTGMNKQTIKYVPGLFKIFDEIVANASDHYYRLKNLKNSKEEINLVKDIKITIDKESGVISVYNSGDGIDVVVHPEHDVYVPELIFGNLLTSTNYTDDEKMGVGQNGIGGKATNVFSEWFEIETVDHNRKKIYTQRFSENMSVIGKPSIKACQKKPYTMITFKPDYARFAGGMTGLSDDMYEVMRKRVYDLCAVVDKDINIYFNDKKLEFKTFENYVNLYLGDKNEQTRTYEKINDKWEIIASYNNFGGFEQVSFVNGLLTIRGGKHVDYIVNQIIKKLTELIAKKLKNTNIKPQAIKDNLFIFIKSTIVNPTFDSQNKETLTTPLSKFGSKAEVGDKFIDKLFKTGIAEKIMEICAVHETKTLKKTDGKKRDIIRGLPLLEDATFAGTAKGKDCLLILTEGNSAMSTALAGLVEVGREKYGVFPLKGKIMNVKDVDITKIANNDEIANIKKILGLESGKKYIDINDLRYGGILLMADQDGDGSHIKALAMNLFHTLWPSLITDFKFIHCLQTPIVKAKRRNDIMSFYSLPEFEEWQKQNPNGWDIKYYKGLGTSTDEEAKEYFRNMKKVTYIHTDKSNEQIDLAFNKKRADDRKHWLGGYERKLVLDHNTAEITYEDFINKELIHFSNYDIERSIPNLIDGLKISQRKILYSCFKRNLTDKEIRVAQLAAYVSEHAAYHHGEASLQGAIINMAQDFVGSNNINMLVPSGQFGCLAPETEIIMWNTSIKKARDIVVGDKLIGDNGTMRKVLKTTNGIDEMYKIVLKNNDYYIVNSQHILTLMKDNKLIDIKLEDILKLSTDKRKNLYCVKNYTVINWPYKCVIDPYNIGQNAVNGIPINYIVNNKTVRLEVLAGIVDKYAHKCVSFIEINVTNFEQNIIKSIKLLCNSLGYTAYYDANTLFIDINNTDNIYTFTIEPIGKGEFYGWSLDGNQRFLLADFTITHNSRLHGGKDASQPRYIHTLLTDVATSVFKKQDNCVLKYTDDDGLPVEPEYYVPIIPMILVNGVIGIGTGFSTTIPAYNPLDIVNLLKRMLLGEHVSTDDDLVPWYRGFKGDIKTVNNKLCSVGKFHKSSPTKIEVTELPIGYWTFDFKADLETMLDKNPEFKKYENMSAGNDIHFVLHFASQTVVDKYMRVEANKFTKFENDFKLVTTRGLSTNNIYAFNSNCQITKYDTAFDIINEFYDVRLTFYKKRKEFILAKLQHDADLMLNKIRFIKEVVSETIYVHKMKKADLEQYLEDNEYLKNDNNYDYIIRIPVYNLTTDKVADLEADIKKALDEIDDLNKKTLEQMWSEELDDFVKAYEKHCVQSDSNKKVKKIKK